MTFNYKIYHLADKPEHINACAAWAYGRWGVQKETGSLERALERFKDGAQKDNLPLTLVAVNTENNLPVAMGSLWESDGTLWPDKTPWIASIYTLYRYEGRGIASAIIKKLEKEAKRLGYNELYLQSGSAASFYKQFNYKKIDTVKTDATAAGTETLFSKSLLSIDR